MASTIGSLQIDILANIARLQDDMNKATRSVGGAMSSIEKSVGYAQKALLGLGVGISFAALIGQVNKAVDTLAKLDDMAQKTGSSVENLSRLQKVASQFGQDFGAVDVAIGKLAKGLAGIDDAGGKTAKALNAIGISQQFVKSNDPSQVMVEIAKRLQGYQDGASKAALATDLFGKAGIELLPYLNDLSENVDKVTGSTAESASKAAKFQDDLGNLKVKFDELVTSIVSNMLPALDAFITKVNQILQFKSIFSSVGGIDAKDYDKEITNREKSLKQVMAMRSGLMKDTTANKINEFIFGDIKTADAQIKIYNDEIKALKDLKQASEALKASPYVSPTSGKTVLDYKGEEAEKALAAEVKARQKINDDARKKAADDLRKYQEQEREDWLKEETQRYKTQVENEKEIYEQKLKNIDLLQKQSEDRFREEHRLQEELLREQKRANEEFSKSLTDALFRGFEKGKDFIKNFKDTLINAFQTLILRPRIEAIISGTGIGSLLSGTANASEGGAGGLFGGLGGGDIFGTIKSLFSGGNSAIVGGIEGIGASLADGLGGIRDTIGGFVGANAGVIANLSAFSGAALSLLKGDIKGAAFQGAGAGIGLALGGPLGGAIGSFLGGAVGGLFGGAKLPPRVTESRSSTYSSGQFSAFEGADVGKRKLGAASTLDALNETFSKQIGSLLSAFDIDQTIYTNSLLTKKKNVRARFQANIGGTEVAGFEQSFGKKGDFAQAFESMMNSALGEVTISAIKASKLPNEIRYLFAEAAIYLKEDVSALIAATIKLKGSQEQLANTFGITVEQSARAARNTLLQGKDLIAYVNKLASAALATKTIGETLVAAQTSMLAVTKSDALPQSVKSFDLIIKSIDKTTYSGIKLFNSMFGIRDQFIAFSQQVNGLKGNVKDALFGIVSDAERQSMANADVAKLFGDLGRNVPASIDELIALGKSIDYTTKEGLDLAAVFPSLVEAFNQTQNAVDSLINSLRDTSSFKTLIDYQRYTGVARNYGTAFANNFADTMPSYSVGTSFVPETGPAMLHQGEAVLTRGENASLRESNALLVNEIRSLNAKVERLVYSADQTASTNKRMADILVNVTPNGDAIQMETVA
jgi:hypothetical protein